MRTRVGNEIHRQPSILFPPSSTVARVAVPDPVGRLREGSMGKTLEELGLTDEPIHFAGTITTARGQLALFVSELPPKLKRLVVGEGLTGWEAFDWEELTEKELRDLDIALKTYLRLLRRVVKTAKANREQQVQVIADYQHVYTRKFTLPEIEKRRGAPIKDVENRLDVRRLQEFQGALGEVLPPFALTQKKKSEGGFLSGDEQILEDLLRAGYAEDVANAVVDARDLEGAAMRLTARRHQLSLQTMRASISRAKRILSQRPR
jgi:hypothetical protein